MKSNSINNSLENKNQASEVTKIQTDHRQIITGIVEDNWFALSNSLENIQLTLLDKPNQIINQEFAN